MGNLTGRLSERIAVHPRNFCVLFGICLLLPALGQGENCPWLNAATAGGLLGGNVTMEVTHPGLSDTTCKFVLNTESAHAQLEIVVHTMATIGDEFPQILADCGTSSTPLKAIGNEAVECTRNDGTGDVTEQIVSRVRERAFFLKWTMPKSSRAINAQLQDEIREKIRNIAEQIAGSLF